MVLQAVAELCDTLVARHEQILGESDVIGGEDVVDDASDDLEREKRGRGRREGEGEGRERENGEKGGGGERDQAVLDRS